MCDVLPTSFGSTGLGFVLNTLYYGCHPTPSIPPFMNPGRITLYVISAILFGLFWVSGGDELRDYLPYYAQRFVGRTVSVRVHDDTIHAEVARSNRAKAQGLSDRQNLPTGKGMLFTFSMPATYEFWMKDMRLPITIVWIRDGKIVDISRGVPAPAGDAAPVRVQPKVPVTEVLEIGTNQGGNWVVGDAVTIKDDKPLFLP